MRRSFATYFEDYFLRFSVILDPAITITITNDETRLINYKLAFIGNEIWFGDKTLPILGYRTIILKMGNQTMLLENVAYCPRLLTTLIALQELRKKGIYWNNQKILRAYIKGIIR
jgi:ABC-type tungstate transport system substrate-binding protein